MFVTLFVMPVLCLLVRACLVRSEWCGVCCVVCRVLGWGVGVALRLGSCEFAFTLDRATRTIGVMKKLLRQEAVKLPNNRK